MIKLLWRSTFLYAGIVRRIFLSLRDRVNFQNMCKLSDSLVKMQDTAIIVSLFTYFGFYITFNTVQVISGRVVGRAEETTTYSWSRFCTVNCRPSVSNYQLWRSALSKCFYSFKIILYRY